MSEQDKCNAVHGIGQTSRPKSYPSTPLFHELNKVLSEKAWQNEQEKHEIEQAMSDLNDETVQKVLRILHLAGR